MIETGSEIPDEVASDVPLHSNTINSDEKLLKVVRAYGMRTKQMDGMVS